MPLAKKRKNKQIKLCKRGISVKANYCKTAVYCTKQNIRHSAVLFCIQMKHYWHLFEDLV